ncbi:peptide-methionine (S)-S-oxide reductase MsrA [Nereida sp. MMG025]|uniref:peptide-methionine (S)-S-oxide reductase MsrA n=1 Tax=Nereida sp. MMG025 TaxID=2909981 RepID=UPI001EFFB1B9|nr:peptide-methionine (S)-S-oxide reductase MsrA [Nereida sp. MMG025]MCF6444610.1 peptide-methionine (S)-S-oxide reductase MsrA [Nereida sp. MMG025]
MITHKTWKPITLISAILLSMTIDCCKAQAADLETLTVAGGCFWCVESDFETIEGVVGVTSGYTGGDTPNPEYREVARGGTGHLEAVEINYDPEIISADRLLRLFVRSIDPLDADGQFCDRGAHYSTAIFVSNPAEKALAEQVISEGEAQIGQPFATRILPAKPFYPAEAFHQDYYKSDKITLTRFGPKTRAEAYTLYRKGCGRDARVAQVWGNDAPFVGKYLTN